MLTGQIARQSGAVRLCNNGIADQQAEQTGSLERVVTVVVAAE
jgi:hypothetical protein